jgi:hypothetical protein
MRLIRSPLTRRARRREAGQALVEFTLILPVLLALLVGILKFGILYHNYITLTDAVRVGARQLSLGRGLPDPCTPAVTRTINAGGGLNLTSSNDPANTAGVGQVKITLITPDTCGTLASPGPGYTGGNLVEGDAVTLEASYPCDLSIFGIDFYPSCQIRAKATEAVE